MNYQMIYDGQKIHWTGLGTFKATSGKPKYQVPNNQCIPDKGPVPEGYYKIFISDHGAAKDDGRNMCALKPSWGIQEIPRGAAAGKCEPFWANWGGNRARMEPADQKTKVKCAPINRGGFYLHDSTKGYSSGCLEVENRIFPLLRKYNQNHGKGVIILKVEYSGGSTNGGTKI